MLFVWKRAFEIRPGPMPACMSVSSSKRNLGGFTLLELLVVVAIIAMLAAYAAPRYFSQVSKSERGVARSQVQALSRAIAAYRLDVGSFPALEEGLQALLQRPAAVTGQWNGPYLEKPTLPMDPWGRPYGYRVPGPNGTDFEVFSLGKDGQVGGEGEAADVSSLE